MRRTPGSEDFDLRQLLIQSLTHLRKVYSDPPGQWPSAPCLHTPSNRALTTSRESPAHRQTGPLLESSQGQTTPGLLPGKSHGRRSLVDYSPQGRKESDTTKGLHYHHSRFTSQSCPLTPQTEAAPHFIQLQGSHGRSARVGRSTEGGRLSGSNRGPSPGPPLSRGMTLGK